MTQTKPIQFNLNKVGLVRNIDGKYLKIKQINRIKLYWFRFFFLLKLKSLVNTLVYLSEKQY